MLNTPSIVSLLYQLLAAWVLSWRNVSVALCKPARFHLAAILCLFAVGLVGPGETVTYENVPISFFVFSGDPVEFPSAWTLQFSVYVDGGTRPTPTPGVDHQIQIPFVFDSKSNPIVIEEVLTLVPASCFFNCAE